MKNIWRNSLGAVLLLGLLLSACALAFLQLEQPEQVPVLVYHCVGEDPIAPAGQALYVSERAFARQMAFLKGMGYHTVFASELAGRCQPRPSSSPLTTAMPTITAKLFLSWSATA